MQKLNEDVKSLETLIASVAPSQSGKAEELLSFFGSLSAVLDSAPDVLVRQGLSPTAAHYLTQLPYLFAELTPEIAVGERISIEDIARVFGARYGYRNREYFRIYFLTEDDRLCDVYSASSGLVDKVHLDSKDWLKTALSCGAVKAVAVHNHPSGDVFPSMDDVRLTGLLRSDFRNFDITLIDHLIVGLGKCFSCRREKTM